MTVNRPRVGRRRAAMIRADKSETRSIHDGVRGNELSVSTNQPRTSAAMVRQRPCLRFVPVQSVMLEWPPPRTGRSRVRVVKCPRTVHRCLIAVSYPSHHRRSCPVVSKQKPRMTSFDPASVRQAVAEFTPRRPEKFEDLMPARDVIAELRQKRASYRAIAELLTQHCLPTSKTAIAVFCHEVLGEIVRPRRRPGRKRPVVPTSVSQRPRRNNRPPRQLPPRRLSVAAVKTRRRAVADHALPRCACLNLPPHETTRFNPQRQRWRG